MTLERQISYLKKRGQFVDDYLDFYSEILAFQANQQAKLKNENVSIFGKIKNIDSRLQNGLPLLGKDDLSIDPNVFQSSISEIISIFEHYPQTYPTGKIETLRNTLTNTSTLSTELFPNFISANKSYFVELSQTSAIEPGLLIFIAKTASYPFLRTFADVFTSYLSAKDKIWFRSACPLCGNTPAMARLEKETGQRHLWCTVCHTEWPFTRNQCPSCSLEAPSKSRYFFDESENLYRVYVCEHCKNYIKTIDENQFTFIQPLDMAMEYLITHHLDEIAANEGYLSMLWWDELDRSVDL